ncbi:Smg-4/UPF3 family-domain-containing protein [Favolaschia claudopus]|uniref:Smg-4/UPF3 family-domain-containing protein n=1 Tax=Favolaschia claudopus TaxID=2862362 RepID=A0AAW0DCB0_9AGAR
MMFVSQVIGGRASEGWRVCRVGRTGMQNVLTATTIDKTKLRQRHESHDTLQVSLKRLQRKVSDKGFRRKPSHRNPRKSANRDKRDRDRLSQPPPTERFKTVVRRLPPNLPEGIFWQSVQSWVSEDTVLWKAFYPGKLRKRLNKENIPSRAYIAFKNEELLAQFSREYDGHLFRDKAGNESYAVVEFAPYQKIPPEKKKVDARSGTIEKDEDYISFLESLNADPSGAEPPSLESLIAANRPPSPPKTTPPLGSPQSRESRAERERNRPSTDRPTEEEERRRCQCCCGRLLPPQAARL